VTGMTYQVFMVGWQSFGKGTGKGVVRSVPGPGWPGKTHENRVRTVFPGETSRNLTDLQAEGSHVLETDAVASPGQSARVYHGGRAWPAVSLPW